MSTTEKAPIHLIGNAHLDPIWLWRWQEGCGEVLQTFRSALDRLNEYPDFIFTCSSASYYRWVEEIEPDMFEEIKQRVKEGRWVPVNGWWVQPDCNMPSGESFARQALYSQLYYYEKFGRICKTGYNVDSFGHCAMLPQLLKLGGMDNYVMNRPGMHENPEIPEDTFWWESPDGSRVMTYRIQTGYGQHGQESIDRTLKVLDDHIEKKGHGMMLFYGVGNHGGGPTRGDIEYLQQKMQEEGYKNLEFSSPDQYFKYMYATPLDLPVWTSDLQHHASGCYAVTGMVKQLNRFAENALAGAEKWDTVAHAAFGTAANTNQFAEAWRDVLFNQFHDIFDGCSIREAYDDVRETMGHAMTIAQRTENNALQKITRRINTWIDGVGDPVNGDKYPEIRHHNDPERFPRPVVVFNPLSWEVNVPVRTYYHSEMVKDSDGNPVAFQNVRSSRSNDDHTDTVFMAKVPALGYATYWLWMRTDENASVKTSVREIELEMENKYIYARIDRKTGCLSFISRNDRKWNNWLRGQAAAPIVIDDHKSDTWAHMVFKFHDVIGQMECISVEEVEKGPVRAVVRSKFRFRDSVLTQDFILAEDQPYIRVKCKVNWQEPHTLLKFSFPLAGNDEISTYEIPDAFIKRPCNGEEEPAQRWADMTCSFGNERRGIAIINDSKYSYDCPGAELRLTGLRNCIFADHYSHRPAADFAYTDEGLARFEYGIFIHEGEIEETDIVRRAAEFNSRPVAVPASYHKGVNEPQRKSYLNVSSDGVSTTALKYCEDGSGSLILRCYETKGKRCRARISSTLFDFDFYSDFTPHQIKTYRIEPDGKIYVVDFLEGVVPSEDR